MHCKYPTKLWHFADALFRAAIFVFFRERFQRKVFCLLIIFPELDLSHLFYQNYGGVTFYIYMRYLLELRNLIAWKILMIQKRI